MATSIFVSVRLNVRSNKAERHKISGINLKCPVKAFKEKIGDTLNLPADDLELICFGKCLNPDETLESYGIKHGMTVHVLQKYCPEPPSKPSDGLSQAETHQLVIALRTALLNPAFRNMVQQLSKPEVLESIVVATPGLANDPIALAILQDPDLLMLLADPTHIHRVVELHPCLAEAATHVAAAFHEEASSSQGATGPVVPSVVSYSLDALSDDDDMDTDSDQSMAAAVAAAAAMATDGGQGRALSPGHITPAQLASALAAVAGSPSTSAGTAASSGQDGLASPCQPQPPTSPQLHAPPPTPRALITSEMFTRAMQHAMGAVGHNNIQSQLQQLRDMGITDDNVSLQALQTTGGDVHAALELIFGDFIDRDSPSS